VKQKLLTDEIQSSANKTDLLFRELTEKSIAYITFFRAVCNMEYKSPAYFASKPLGYVVNYYGSLPQLPLVQCCLAIAASTRHECHRLVNG
jgi:hypothetical protein